jgi:ribosomal protein S18 acetylase RimI-like enzyme
VEVTVRRAVPEDARAIAEVHVRSWRVAYQGLMPDDVLEGLSVEDRAQFWRGAAGMEPESGGLFVAAAGADVLGFCAFATPGRDDDAVDRVAEIGAIYVDPATWRAGVGSALMEAALTELRANGWRSVTLWVLADNRQARKFYARFGFEPDGAEMREERSGRNEVRLLASLEADSPPLRN